MIFCIARHDCILLHDASCHVEAVRELCRLSISRHREREGEGCLHSPRHAPPRGPDRRPAPGRDPQRAHSQPAAPARKAARALPAGCIIDQHIFKFSMKPCANDAARNRPEEEPGSEEVGRCGRGALQGARRRRYEGETESRIRRGPNKLDGGKASYTRIVLSDYYLYFQIYWTRSDLYLNPSVCLENRSPKIVDETRQFIIQGFSKP